MSLLEGKRKLVYFQKQNLTCSWRYFHYFLNFIIIIIIEESKYLLIISIIVGYCSERNRKQSHYRLYSQSKYIFVFLPTFLFHIKMSENKTKITIYDFSYKVRLFNYSHQPPSFTFLYLATERKVYYLS